MRVGFAVGNIGPIGTMDNLIKIAERAEALAYDSLWAVERLLWPVKPQSPYPVTPDGSLPEGYKHVLDPLEALMFVAARTKRVALGTSVINMTYYNPVMLARRISTLDVLSGGRVRLGLGLVEALVASLQNLRHVRAGVGEPSIVSAIMLAANNESEAPWWFRALVNAPSEVAAIPVTSNDGQTESIIIVAESFR